MSFCVMCQSDILESESFLTLACKHSCHMTCFFSYVNCSNQVKKCPTCRQDYEMPHLIHSIQKLREKIVALEDMVEYQKQHIEDLEEEEYIEFDYEVDNSSDIKRRLNKYGIDLHQNQMPVLYDDLLRRQEVGALTADELEEYTYNNI